MSFWSFRKMSRHLNRWVTQFITSTNHKLQVLLTSFSEFQFIEEYISLEIDYELCNEEMLFFLEFKMFFVKTTRFIFEENSLKIKSALGNKSTWGNQHPIRRMVFYFLFSVWLVHCQLFWNARRWHVNRMKIWQR